MFNCLLLSNRNLLLLVLFIFQACTGLDMAQVETLKKCFDSMDKEQNGSISAAAIQMIFKMLGVTVQKAGLGNSIHSAFLLMSSIIQYFIQTRPLASWGIKWMPTSLNLATFAKWQLVLC